jgi:carbohydrate-binding DOMON domain-containing protein
MRLSSQHNPTKLHNIQRFLPAAVFALVAGCAASGGATDGSDGSKADGVISLEDPAGDDKGPGSYVYPSDQVYLPGSFDLRQLEVEPKGNTVEFRVTVDRRIEDPWDSKAWGGNGFSIQMAFIHIDKDRAPGSGYTVGLPGTNVRFAEDEAWDKVVIISPQGPTRVNSEVEAKAAEMQADVVVPTLTRAAGRTLIAVVNTADLGGTPEPSWGYQVLMQSNEGFPAKTDLLTRKVNEFEGQHRFGGGTDYDVDPHVIDIFAGDATGDAKEVELQYEALSAYDADATEPTAENQATVPMIYPAS